MFKYIIFASLITICFSLTHESSIKEVLSDEDLKEFEAANDKKFKEIMTLHMSNAAKNWTLDSFRSIVYEFFIRDTPDNVKRIQAKKNRGVQLEDQEFGMIASAAMIEHYLRINFEKSPSMSNAEALKLLNFDNY